MRNSWRYIVRVLPVLSAVALCCVAFQIFAFWWTLDGVCGNQVVQQVVSPDAWYKLVVFERDCGATTGFSTQVSLLAAGAVLPDRGGNLFVADDDHGRAPSGPGGGPAIAVHWLDAGHLSLAHDARVRIFLAVAQLGDVQVSYDKK